MSTEWKTLARKLLDVACRMRVGETLFKDDELVDQAAHAIIELASPQPAAQPEQPEPGGLTEAQALAIADKYGTRWAAQDEAGISFEKSAFFDFLSEVIAAGRN